jgi:hypothetical protein
MAIRIGEKPLTHAERQVRYKAKKRKEGLYRKEIWAQYDGFFAKPGPNGAWASIPPSRLERQLSTLLKRFEPWEKEVVYAEILEYARYVMPKYTKIFAGMRD